ncbi:MAG: hypothetical protein ACRELY_07400 [Polyangiaceae bacterium]
MGNRVRLSQLAPLSLCAVLACAVVACGLDDTVVTQNNGDGNGGGDASLVGDSSGNADSGSASDDGASSSGDSGVESGPPPRLVYGNTATDLFSYDIDAHTLTHLVAFSGCNPNDIAIDASGQIYGLQLASSSIYRIGGDGACSAADLFAGGSDGAYYIGARTATPFMVAVSDAHNNFYSIDSSANPMNEVKLQENFSVASTNGDVACSPAGTCWSTSAFSDCAGAVTDSCLYSIPQDGSAVGTLVGKVSLIPVGLAYRGGDLYGFGADGTIWKLTTASATSTQLPVNAASGTTAPPAWSGAASFGNAD